MSHETDDAEECRVVHVELLPPDDGLPIAAALLHVEVEDYSRADANTQVVGRLRRSNVVFTPGVSERFEVEVPARLIDDRDMYSVRAHVDVSGSGSVERGDLITVQSYPVLTRGHPDEVVVEIRRV